jgi:hypothetical protein
MGSTGKVAVTASEKEDGKWIDAGCRAYRVVDGEVDNSDNWYIGPRKKHAGEKQIPAGKYLLKCEYNDFKKEVPFEVKSAKTTKVHVVFKPFFIGAKCTNGSARVSYEIYSSSGQLIYDKKAPCSKTLKVTLDDGKYMVEATIEDGKGEAQFSVGTGKPNKLILDLTNLNHEEEIKADSPEEVVVVPVTPKKKSVSVNEKQETTTGKLNIGDKQVQISGISKEDMKSIQNLGALLGGAGGVQKKLENKPMQGIKESLIVALPYMEKTKECYGSAQTLEAAKLCDVIANEGAKKAKEKMESVVGMKGKKVKTIAHTEWNEAIRVKELAREENDIKNAKLYIICIDKGVGMGQLKECAANNGEFTPKKTEVEQLGDMLKMFGGMK